MEFFDNLKDFFTDFFDRTSKGLVIVLGILIFFLISTIVLLFVQLSKVPQKKLPAVPEVEFVKDEEFIFPYNMNLSEDYYFSRITKDSWTEEDIQKWFTLPNLFNLNELGTANDALVEEILGVAL